MEWARDQLVESIFVLTEALLNVLNLTCRLSTLCAARMGDSQSVRWCDRFASGKRFRGRAHTEGGRV